MILLFANNAVSTIASPINAAATSVQLAAGTGALFPNPVAGQFFKLTFVDALTGLVNEIVNVTQRVGDVLTIVRAQEGTTAESWLAGDSATNMTTAQTQNNFIQVQQAQSGLTNFAIDTGSANSYAVALTPAVTTRIQGLYVRILAANPNSGPSTLNLGAGSFPIVNPDGSALGTGAIIGGGIFEVVDDGTHYQLISLSQQAQSSAGAATTGDVKWRPTTETITGWVVANGSQIGNAASNANQLASATAQNLFEWHWNNFSNSQCPVFLSNSVATTRGANAAADFAANLQIRVIDMRGITALGMDTMQGTGTNLYAGVPTSFGNSDIPGSVLGENLHALLAAELTPHTHSGTTGSMNQNDPHSHSGTTGSMNQNTVHTHGHNAQIDSANATLTGASGINVGTVSLAGGATINNANVDHLHPFSTNSVSINHQHGFMTDTGAGLSGTSHNTVQLGMVGSMYLKL